MGMFHEAFHIKCIKKCLVYECAYLFSRAMSSNTNDICEKATLTTLYYFNIKVMYHRKWKKTAETFNSQ